MENINDMGTVNTDKASRDTINTETSKDTINTETNRDIVNTEIQDLKNFNIQTIQPDRLVDIETIELDKNLPVEERVREFVRQIKNPYFFRCGKFIVQVEYSDTGKSMNDCLKEFMDSQVK